MGRASSPTRRALQLLLRLSLAAGLTLYLLWKSHPKDVLSAAAGVDWRPMAVAVLLVLLDRALMAYRWVALLCTVEPGTRPPLASLMRIFFVSTFMGTFLPASVGSDVLRSYSVSRLRVNPSDAVASVLMDRVLGIASILIMGILGLALARELTTSPAMLIAFGAAAGVCAAALLVVLAGSRVAPGEKVGGWRSLGAVRQLVGQLFTAIGKYAQHPGVLAGVLVCSLAVQGLRIVQAYFLGRGLGLELPVATYFALIPMILLVMLLPITFNGIGTSQAAFLWFFGQAGVLAAPAFALSLLFVALGIVGNLPGAVLYVWGSRPAAEG